MIIMLPDNVTAHPHHYKRVDGVAMHCVCLSLPDVRGDSACTGARRQRSRDNSTAPIQLLVVVMVMVEYQF